MHNKLLIFVFSLFNTALYANHFDWCFIENNGQDINRVNYRHTLPNGTLFLENDQLTYHLYDMTQLAEVVEHGHRNEVVQHHAFNVEFVNSNQDVAISHEDKTSHYFNFFIGSDVNGWASEIYGHHKVAYANIYTDVDFIMYDYNQSLKYDFIVKPGGNPDLINLKYNGLNDIFIDEDGQLHLINTVSEIIEDRPYVYQMIDGKKYEIKSNYILNDGALSFEFPEGYNTNYELVIDPTLIFSTYSGATQVYGANCSAFDQAGNIYSAGNTPFGGYPTTIGSYQGIWGGATPAAIQKFDQGGNMLYATYLGGDFEHPLEIKVNGNNELVVLMNTSGNFPIIPGAVIPAFSGLTDYAVGILNNAGTNLMASTYVGGSGDEGIANYDMAGGLFIDNANDIFITGMSNSADYPTTAGAFQVALPGNESGVVTKLDGNLTNIQWSTYFGGTLGNDIVNSINMASNGSLYIVGNTTSADLPTTAGALNVAPFGQRDGFVANLSPNGTALNFSTYIGTGNDDRAKFIEINAADEIFVGGSTRGAYPISAGVFSSPSANNMFVHKLTNDLSATLYSTAIGCLDVAQPEIYMTAFGLDYCDKVYFTGASTGNNFPTTPDAYTTNEKGMYMCVLEPEALALNYGSYFGGDDNAQHFHPASKSVYTNEGILYHTECTQSTNYPLLNGLTTQNGAFQDGAVFIFDFEFSLPLTQIDLGPDVNVCILPVNLNASHPDNINVEYLWSTTETTPDIDVNAAGTYSVMVYNTCDTVYDTIQVTVSNVLANYDVNLPNGCAGSEFTFTDQSITNGANVSWFWDFGDGKTSTVQNPTHVFDSEGTYAVSLNVTSGGCDGFYTQNIEVFPTPTANFDFSPQFLTVENSEIRFTNLSSGEDSYIWNFGSAFGVSAEENPVFIFPEESDMAYPIILTVINSDGCSDEITKYLEFQDVITFYVPNAFTPGSSGPNSTFTPIMTSGFEPYQFHLLIYNRWGEIVFESFNDQIGWDGWYDGKLSQPGVYVWKIQFKETMTDKKHTHTGHVSIIR